jgi:uncharacterized protein YkwD
MPSLAHTLLRSRTPLAVAVAGLCTASAPALASTSHHHHHRAAAHRARACANADTPALGASRAAIKTAVVCLINQQRVVHGLPALHEDSRLDRSAQGWTNRMVSTKQFSHGTNFAARISATGYHPGWAGENIATGFATPQDVVSAWMGSPGHCRNILDPDYASVGTGVVNRGIAGFSVGPSTWTQDFATPLGARTPSSNWSPANTIC